MSDELIKALPTTRVEKAIQAVIAGRSTCGFERKVTELVRAVRAEMKERFYNGTRET